MKSKLIALVAIGLLALTPASQATLIAYKFTVTVGMTDYDGTFAFDSSIIGPPGTSTFGTDLLTNLDFMFMGITYDQTTANTGEIDWGAAGNLKGILFGSNCDFGACYLDNPSDWLLSWQSSTVESPYRYFAYVSQEGTNIEGVVSSLVGTSVPEPSAYYMLSIGLAGLSLTRRKIKA